MPRTRLRLSLFALAAATAGASAQAPRPLSLGDALDRADRAAFANRVARGQADAAASLPLAALRGVLPSLRFDGGFVRTDDPIGAFGTTLRQRTITQADFDPSRLNRPAPINNYTGAVVLEQPVFNADAWAGRAAAQRGAGAAGASAEWARLATRAQVVRAYFGAILARELVGALENASRAAHAHGRQAESMVEAGLATRSDALLAAVKAGEIDAQLAEARADAATAVHQLALLLGDVAATEVVLPTTLPATQRLLGAVAADSVDVPMGARADVEAAQLARSAAHFDRQRARALYFPRVNAFARYDWNSSSRVYGGEYAWTVGVMASWSPFAGASELAERRAAGGREAAAAAAADAAGQQAALEAEQTRNALRAAIERLHIADRAVAQSVEAHRIVARKYEGGLATVVELFDAAAVERQAALGAAAARYALIAAAAARRQALGQDPGTLAELETTGAAARGLR